MTTPITKEWLQQTIAEYEASRDEIPFGLETNSAMELEAFKIALAAMDAEPVAFINGAWTLVYYRPPEKFGLKIGDKLYTAPPAPVVPVVPVVPVNGVTSGKPLTITMPDISSKAFWSGAGKNEVFHPQIYKRWVKEAIELACAIACIEVRIK